MMPRKRRNTVAQSGEDQVMDGVQIFRTGLYGRLSVLNMVIPCREAGRGSRTCPACQLLQPRRPAEPPPEARHNSGRSPDTARSGIRNHSDTPRLTARLPATSLLIC